MMKNALGLRYKSKPYRNYFFVYSPSEEWEDLVSKGFAEKSEGDKKIYYWLTFEATKLVYGKQISKQYYDEL